MSFTFDGLGTGLNTSEIIRQLMSIERIPIQRMETRKAEFQKDVDAFNSLSSKLGTAKTSASSLLSSFGFARHTATSSDEDAMAVSANANAAPGSLTVKVMQLATTHQLSSGGFASDTTVVGAGTATIAAGLSALGISNVAADGAATAGKHEFAVTSSDGSGAVITVDGHENVVSAADLGSGSVVVSDGNGGSYTLTTAASLTVGEGSASVIRGTATTSLKDLASQINGVSGGATAQVLNLGGGTDPYRLVLTAKDSGTEGAISADLSGFSGFGGGLSDLTAAADATIQIGEGAGALTATRSSNTVNDLLSGVTMELTKADPTKDVTVTVGRDLDSVVDSIKKFVEGVNGVVGEIKKHTSYDAENRKAGPLFGNSSVRRLQSGIQNAMSVLRTEGDFRTLGSIGISSKSDGTYELDEAKLRGAMEANFGDVVDLLARTVEADDSRVSLVTASSATANGTYGVVVTTAAEQAAKASNAFGTLGADETITVRVGSTEVAYTASAGSNATSVANGLNNALVAAGLDVRATEDAGTVVLASVGYGSSAAFDVKSSATGGTGFDGGAGADTYTTYTGVNVAGTIDGETATGIGQTLTGSAGSPKGLALKITATAADVSGAGGSLSLGDVTFANGLFGSFTSFADAARDPDGILDAARTGAEASQRDWQSRIDARELRLEAIETRYRRQFTALERVIANLNNQGQWLAGQMAGLSNLR